MEGLVYALKVAGVLAVALLPLFFFLELFDRRHDRVWRRFAREKGAILTQTARGPFKYWDPKGPRKLEVRVGDAWVTLRHFTQVGAGTTEASTSVAGFPPFLVRSKAEPLRTLGPGRQGAKLELGDRTFDSQFEIRSSGDPNLPRLFDETIRRRHFEAPHVIVGTNRDGLLTAKMDGWGGDTSDLSAMVALLEAYVERNPSRRGT